MDGKPKARGGGNSLPFVTIPLPALPMKNTASGYLPGRAPISNSSATRTLPTTKVGRHRYLELQLEQLRAEIITYAKYADQIAGVVEGCGNTVRTFPQGTNLPFVRTLRQYAKLSITITLCDEDPEFLMGNIMLWREDHKDIDAKDMLDAACSIWNPKKYWEWPSLANALWDLAKNRDLLKTRPEGPKTEKSKELGS
ncbi:hypothetical protein GTA08_BOTSDO12024 [Botryosphaeria dothidea]|uniref:Uncharacterized protein n=1 Tax=Botryosphaeria dothidea TaxID=55169 RepID=A0A8H4N8C8_9PEZI|nr:hypothetical protein GTA08_BOTSDO12024 [Botryosphaeria dothidea]